jgi:hypothetical protein
MTISRDDFGGLGPSLPPADYRWFHVVLTMYGNWLPGDERGFRTHHHRVHVPGDYRTPPPPGMFAATLRRSRSLLKYPPVRLAEHWRPTVGTAVVSRTRELGGFVYVAAVSVGHMHLLAKLPSDETRNSMGSAKKHAWFTAREHGWTGKLWAKRGKFTPVRDRRHLDSVLRYIIAHEKQGAWVWVWEGFSDELVERLRQSR